MQLTQFSDYALRVLIYLTQKEDGFANITEIADFYQISRNHLVKVVHFLSTNGVLHTVRGKSGGLRLARLPQELRLGELIRLTEVNFELVECFSLQNNQCVITPQCRLQGILREAHKAFLAVLDRYTLADAVKGQIDIQGLLLRREIGVQG